MQNNCAFCDRSVKLGRDLDIAILDMGPIDFLLQTENTGISCDIYKLASGIFKIFCCGLASTFELYPGALK